MAGDHHNDMLAAEGLVELVGPAMGLLDMELAKLATAAGANAEITADDVTRTTSQLTAGGHNEVVGHRLDTCCLKLLLMRARSM